MSRRFCITVYRALASRTCLQLWSGAPSGALASRVGISPQGRSRSTTTSFAAKLSDSRARRSQNWYLLPRRPSAGRTESVRKRAICCCSLSLARSWKKQTFIRRRTARVVQHQSPSPQNSPGLKTTTEASPEKPSKPRWQLVFRLYPRVSVKPRSTLYKQCHMWRRSSTFLDMVPLSFLRNRIL